jgi:sugar lactone lactonase YvrE
LFSLFAVVAMTVCAGRFAVAQAVPQLLPYTVTAVVGGGAYGNSSAYYNNGTNTTCAYLSWSGSAYVTKTDSSHMPTDTVGDGCLNNEVAVTTPHSVVSDSEGNLFFIDSGNNLIRRADAHTGIVTTVGGYTVASTSSTAPTFASIASQSTCPSSGNTQADTYGDGCLATEVPMASPEALAIDAAGNIWFTDYYLGAVREIVKSTGVIQTVVNQSVSVNPGLTSGLNGFTWTKGVGYVGYNASNVANGTTGSTTYITAAKALLFRPYGLAFDKAGNLYVAENYNNTVEVVNLSNATRTIAGYTVYPNEILTIAGSGCPGRLDTYTLGESASSSTTPTLANMSCDSSAYYGHSNGTSPYPSTGSTLDSPYQVAVDNSGNIYIADEYPYNVRVINTTTGYISTFAGVLNSGRTATVALASGAASSTKLSSVYGVTTDSLGNVYISDYASTSDYLERVDIATGELYPIGGQVSTSAPASAMSAAAGATYCSAKTDAIGDGCPATQATFYKGYFVTIDPAGNLYIGDSGNNLVRKLSVGTQFSATSVGSSVTQTLDVHFGVGDSPGTSTVPNSIADFTIGTAGTCTKNSDTSENCPLPVTFTPALAGLRTAPLVVTSALGKVSIFTLTGTGQAPALVVDPSPQTTLASTGLTSVNELALDNAGNLYAAVPGASSIIKISSVGTESNLGSSLSEANAVAVDGSGNVYTALATGSVVEIPANGSSEVTVGSGFTNPAGLAVDAYGNLYVTDEAASTVTEILAGTGAQVTLASNSTVAALSQPTGIAVDGYGNVFVSSTVENEVIEIPFSGAAAKTLGTNLNSPLGLAVDAAGSLYIADSKNNRVAFIPNEGGTLNSNDQLTIISGLGTPTGVAVTGQGGVYVSDASNNAIYKYSRSSASINFGNENLAVGQIQAGWTSASADIVSVGNQAVTFSSTFATASGANTADFTLSPSSIPSGTLFPAAGYGVPLTADYSPTGTTVGSRSATYTFNATNATAPALALSGTASHPSELATASISTTPTRSQTDWIYGQTVVLNFNVLPNNLGSLETPTGSLAVTVDGTSYTVQLSASATVSYDAVGSLSVVSLGAGTHTVTAIYNGDSNFGGNTAAPLSFKIDQAPLVVTGGTLNKAFDAPLSTLTGTSTGVVNNDVIGVSYSTTAVWNSPVIAAGYPITPSVSGTALSNYSVTLNNGTLYVTKDSTVVAVSASSNSVNPTTQVTLTATVSNQTSYPNGTSPTGQVAFYNTVNSVTTQIGANAPLNSSGIATLTTTFAVTGATTTNSVTAVYLGDTNFVGSSTASGLAIVSGVPTFALAQPGTASLTVSPGQSGLLSFNVTPAFGYNGIITFSCSNLPATIGCSFSPASITANGTTTLEALTITTSQGTQAINHSKPKPNGKFSPFSLAALPALLALAGFARRTRKAIHGSVLLLLVAMGVLCLATSGCGGAANLTATPQGADTITVVASGTGGTFASVTQQFNVTLTVQ